MEHKAERTDVELELAKVVQRKRGNQKYVHLVQMRSSLKRTTQFYTDRFPRELGHKSENPGQVPMLEEPSHLGMAWVSLDIH